MSGPGHNIPPSYLRPSQTHRQIFGHDNEPELDQHEQKQRRAAKQKNADKRFNSPFGFHEPKYKKVSFYQRYPKLVHRTLITVSLLAFFRY